jgi:hypothetical protein
LEESQLLDARATPSRVDREPAELVDLERRCEGLGLLSPGEGLADLPIPDASAHVVDGLRLREWQRGYRRLSRP